MDILSLDLSTKSEKQIINKEQLDQYKNKFVVYLLIFPNNKIYCGYSSNIKRRWRSEEEYKNQLVYKAIKKYKWKNIKKYIYKSFNNKQDALQLEYNIIKKYNLQNQNIGYNIANGGRRPSSWKKMFNWERPTTIN